MNAPTITLSARALALARHLHAELRERWTALPRTLQAPTPPPYHAAAVPADLKGRRVELIVEASDLSALRAALASDAEAVVLDFDDTFAPNAANVQAAYDALGWVAASGKPLLARPRALYATERHLHLDAAGAIAALCDLSAVLCARPERPIHIYVPKVESVAEAAFWNDALTLAEAQLHLAPNTVNVCLQIETFAAALHADALLHALRGRAFGVNAGRWDYVFSLIKHLGAKQLSPVPPRSQLGMDASAMQAYAEVLLELARSRAAQAIGGSAALAPDSADPQPALHLVTADKRREAAQGFVAAWAGLPELLSAVRAGWDNTDVGERQAASPPSAVRCGDVYTRLTTLPTPAFIAIAEVQDAIGLALAVFEAWFAGRGVVVRRGRIEDTATAELARAQLWQWVHCAAPTDEGAPLCAERYLALRRLQAPDASAASRLLDALVLSAHCPAYFPREAQRLGDGA